MSAILYLAAVAYGIYTGAYGVAIICTGGILFEIAEGRKVIVPFVQKTLGH